MFGSEDITAPFFIRGQSLREAVKSKKPFILLKTMTEPEDVIYMKKASAVLTTEGGPSCHAAIVCKMLGKSCVTGLNQLSVPSSRSVIRIFCPELGSYGQYHLIKEGTICTISGDTVTFEYIPGESNAD